MSKLVGINKNRRKETGSIGVSSYLWVIFILLMIAGLFKSLSDSEVSSGKSLYTTGLCYLIVLILILRVGIQYGSIWFNLSGRYFGPFVTMVFFITIIWCCLIGFLNFKSGANLTAYIKGYLASVVPMLLSILITLGAVNVKLHSFLPKIIYIQSLIGSIFVLIVFTIYPLGESRLNFGGPHYVAYSMSSISILSLAMIDKYKLVSRGACVFAYAVFMYINILYQSRGGILLSCFIIPAYLVIFSKNSFFAVITSVLFSKGALVSLFTLAGLLIFLISSNQKVEFLSAWSGSLDRFYGGEQSKSISDGLLNKVIKEYEYSRGAEATDYLAQVNFTQLLFGKGYTGTWYSKYWKTDWPMVHFGPLHFLLMGGVIHAIAFIVLITLAWYKSFKSRKRNSLYMAANVYILYFFIGFLKHGPIRFNYDVIVMWLMIGIGIGCNIYSSQKLVPRRRSSSVVDQNRNSFVKSHNHQKLTVLHDD